MRYVMRMYVFQRDDQLAGRLAKIIQARTEKIKLSKKVEIIMDISDLLDRYLPPVNFFKPENTRISIC
jgi:hypothetical protein